MKHKTSKDGEAKVELTLSIRMCDIFVSFFLCFNFFSHFFLCASFLQSTQQPTLENMYVAHFKFLSVAFFDQNQQTWSLADWAWLCIIKINTITISINVFPSFFSLIFSYMKVNLHFVHDLSCHFVKFFPLHIHKIKKKEKIVNFV